MATILIADDSASMLAFMRGAIEQAGHEALLASCGAKASKILQSGGVELIITDIYMPVIDGFELMSFARSLPEPPRIIAISANRGISDVLEVARHIGAHECIQKPFTAEQLMQAVRCVLGSACQPLNSQTLI